MSMAKRKITVGDLSAILDVSKRSIQAWINSGKYNARVDKDGKQFFYPEDLESIPEEIGRAHV